jgi:hypothetical protein
LKSRVTETVVRSDLSGYPTNQELATFSGLVRWRVGERLL